MAAGIATTRFDPTLVGTADAVAFVAPEVKVTVADVEPKLAPVIVRFEDRFEYILPIVDITGT